MTVPHSPAPEAGPEAAPATPDAFDLIVLGAGVGGMTAALVAALEGQRVLLIEKSTHVGGTSARSSGTVWIPDNPYLHRGGVTDDATLAMEYLDALVGERAPREMRAAFVAAGPQMVAWLEARTDLRFRPYALQPDYRQELPGAALGGRALEPLPFDGRLLGPHFARVGWPLPELMLFRGMMVTRGEVTRLLKLGRSLDAFWLGAKLVLRYTQDRLRHARGTRLVLGNALVARLYGNLLQRNVPTWFECTVTRLIREGGRVSGLVARRGGADVTLTARRGIVMAGGGFPASAALRERYLPAPVAQYTAAFEGCTGETIELAQQVGGALGRIGEDNALWFPSSIATRADGSTAVYPHIVLDRAKPGLIAVNAAGRRFSNEAISYHDFTRAMYRAHRQVPCIPAWLVCDRRFVWRYGLGMIRPRTLSLRRAVRSGYLAVADSPAELARRIGVDADGLVETVRLHNAYARSGVDADFHKGESPYDRAYGDAEHTPNPCLGPIERAPFCAVAVVPTPLGTSLGLNTDTHGQVLDAAGKPVPGLYACGNDMHSAFGGEYPGAGAQLGLAMTFGFAAARHAVHGD
jgi:3-oxosteroid 1-dehydrogenase